MCHRANMGERVSQKTVSQDLSLPKRAKRMARNDDQSLAASKGCSIAEARQTSLYPWPLVNDHPSPTRRSCS
jgi:hypothetical protein